MHKIIPIVSSKDNISVNWQEVVCIELYTRELQSNVLKAICTIRYNETESVAMITPCA